ncbi:MAG TPA: UvrD-helicase domain-containing protein [Vicinamibacterales bacterium]|nr:UvrD-helicase domain-containing protein [Vicinamibacterales bacterium]
MSAQPPLQDQVDRDHIRFSLDETIVVEAAAGTGKTTELVQRILRVLATGRARIEQVVAVTFTEKAAGELKLRIRKELESLRQRSTAADEQANLTDAIQRLEEAHVSTIHGFCADLLRERPVEARIDPLFEVLTEPRAERLFNEAFAAWLHEKLEDPPEGLRRALRRSVWSKDPRGGDDGPVDRIRRAARELSEWRDFTGAWRREPFDRDARLGALILRLRELAALTASPLSTRDPLFTDTSAVRELGRDIETAERFDAADPDGWEARLIDLAGNRDFRRARKGRDRMFSQAATRDEVWAAFDTLGAELDGFQQAADADLAALLHDELREVVDRYERLKERTGALDFVDLLLRARDLLVSHADVRQAFQARFARLFVDEFQDTDPLQAEILLLLAADDHRERNWRRIQPLPGKLFIVGDPKQAIYRFRRADVETYREVCELLESRGARRVFLHTSFRSRPGIQRVVNASFGPVMTGDRQTLQAHYVSLSLHRSDSPAQPSVIALPVPEPYGKRQVAGYAIDKSLPDGVGAFVAWLLQESGWTVTEKTSRDELPIELPLQARHVCILFRRFLHFGDDVTRPYVEALEARGVPHLLVGGKSFHGREEVETIRAALAAIEWPDDELSVFATLRGALFAIDDETLLDYRHRQKSFHPFRPLEPAPPELQPVVDALALLKRLHGRRNYRPVADTVTDLLNATRAHVGFVLRPAGEQALANVLHVAELARQYEINGGMSFRGFVDELRDQADGGQVSEAPILEEGSDGVRLMTAHKAKGLEFPVVILADITAKLKGERADRLIDKERNACYLRLGRWTPVELALQEPLEVLRDEAEGVRVAYVAATRARDLLVVPVVGDVEWDAGWISPLNSALYPPMHARRAPSSASYHPPFRKDSVFRRPDDDPFSSATVQPGVHTFGEGDAAYSVVWWDPHALSLGAEASFGLRRESLIVRDVPSSIVDEGLRDYQRWQGGLDRAVQAGSIPTLMVGTVTEWAGDGGTDPLTDVSAPMPRETAPPGGSPVQYGLFEDPPSLPPSPHAGGATVAVVDLRDAGRTGGARFGELVHAVIATAPLGADDAAYEAAAEVQARILGAPEAERAASVIAVLRVAHHDLLQRAARAAARGEARRECPVTLTAADGSLLEGVVDLAFHEDGRWIVIDFKTDREISQAGIERYSRQVALYASAITRATSVPASAYLMRI